MADVVYNPLLKRNIQYLGGDSGDVDAKIAALQNAINDLQSRLNDLKNTKITKVTAAAQLSELTDGEIFEWQTTTTQQFTQGYFYKKNGDNYTRVDLQPQYQLPIAAADALGGVKVGSGLNIDGGGVLSVIGGDGLKVPRCFTQAQINALTDNDIFEWQGETTADYVQGYFYKKTSNTTTEVIAGSKYLFVSPAVDFGQYSINQGYYTFIENTAFENVIGQWIVKGTNTFSAYEYFTYQPVAVGNKACKYVAATSEFIGFVDITAVNSSGVPTAMSDGATTVNSSHTTTPYTSVIAKFQNINSLETVYCVCVPFNGGINGVMLVDIIDNVIYPIKRVNYLERTAAEDITETTIITAQKDTQPQPPMASITLAGLMSTVDKRAADPIVVNDVSIISVLRNLSNTYNKLYTLHVYGNVSDKPYPACFIIVQISNVLGYTVALIAQSYGELHFKIGYASINPSSSSSITWSNDII